MHPLEKATYKLIRQQGLLAGSETVIIGCSAGPDSMALLQTLSTLRSLLEIDLMAVYVDHGLRPEETGREKDLVAARAKALGVSFQAREVNTNREAKEKRISVEHAARNLRYGIFEELALEFDASRIAVAHTADDQVEEILLRLIRGTGRAGLSGMKMIRDGRIIRPFLTRSKAELLAYLRRYDIPWLEDSSNLETKYLRNRLRLELLPKLTKYNPSISETLRRTALILQDEEIVLDRLTKEAWQELAELNARELKLTIKLKGFLRKERAIQRRLLEKAFIMLSARPQGEKIEQILQLAANGETGSRLHFSGGLRFRKEKEVMLFFYPVGHISARGDLDDSVSKI